MNAYRISKFLFALNTSPAVRERWAADREATLREPEWKLTDDERAAIQGLRFVELFQLGIHPLLLTALANCSGIPAPKMIEELRPLAKDPVE